MRTDFYFTMKAMNINRNNYEEFFLLYTDGELSAQNKIAVENFVVLNPDLAKELEHFKKTLILPDENIIYENKSSLYRTASHHINKINYLEFFLLYVDNEIRKPQKSEVEKFVTQNPQFANEFNLIKQTVLAPAHIEFTNKESLYRKEERKPAPVIGFRFAGLAAAAAVLVLIVAAWLLLQKPAGKTTTVTNTQAPEKKNDIAENKNSNNLQKDSFISNQSITTKVENKNSSNSSNKNKKISKPLMADEEIKTIAHEKNIKENITGNNNKSNDAVVADNAVSSNNTTAVTNNANTANTDVSENNVNANATDVTYLNNGRYSITDNDKITGNGINVIPVSYKELNTEEDINNRNLYVGAFNLNKDKVKGLFKKVKNIFNEKARQSADEDGKLQVAGFGINTNNQ